MNFLFGFAAIAVLISFVFNKNKTILALKIAIKKLVKILPAFLWMLILMSMALYIFSEDQIHTVLANENIYYSLLLAVSCGSVAMIPGFIAFPICGILLDQGVNYMVLAGFTSSLMMVGIVSFPVEKEFLGVKLGLLRNFMSLLIAIIVALMTGLFFGELF